MKFKKEKSRKNNLKVKKQASPHKKTSLVLPW